MHACEQPDPKGLILTVHAARWLKSLFFTVFSQQSFAPDVVNSKQRGNKLQRMQKKALLTSAPGKQNIQT